MIIYVFNHEFPDSSGFAKRCQREIETLSKVDEIIVICRKNSTTLDTSELPTSKHTTLIKRFGAQSKVVHRPENYKPNGLYEIRRNLDILLGLSLTLISVIRNNSQKKIQIVSVTSPLTVPTLCFFIAKLFRVDAALVSFHDLEPEMAMHMKHLKKNDWLMKVEFMLENLVCRGYRKILVTSVTQATVISQRNGLNKNKVCVIPNTTNASNLLTTSRSKDPFLKSGFIVSYMSSLSFDYTVEGLMDFLKEMSKQLNTLQGVKIAVIGGGEALQSLKSLVSEIHLEGNVKIFGKVENPFSILNASNAAIIPWKKNVMTENILPTKLLEYLQVGLPVVVPKFGEFERLLVDKKTALFYNSVTESVSQLRLLITDTSLRRNIGISGKKLYHSSFEPDTLNKEFLTFYKR